MSLHPRRASRIGVSILIGLAVVAAALVVPSGQGARAEAREIRIAQQFGIGYLPLHVMKNRRLLEQQLQQAGLPEVEVKWSGLGSGVAMNDALLSRSLDIASGGVTVFLTVWDRTRRSFGVRGVAILNALPMYLVTANPNIRTLTDFSDKDRIAVTAVKISTMAVTLQMAAEQILGPGKHATYDGLTVSMRHPDAMAALMSGRSEINAYFGTPPFQYQLLQQPGMRKILSSYDVLGGPATFNMLWTRGDFHKENPKIYGAFLAALREAQAFINANPDEATRIYLVEDNAKLDPGLVRSIITDPDSRFTTTPLKSMKYAEFLHKIGTIRTMPESWKDLFFPELHDEPGS